MPNDETTEGAEQTQDQNQQDAGRDGTPTPEALLASLEAKEEAPQPDEEFLKKLSEMDPEKIQDKLPDNWKSALLRQADYSRKTHAISEDRKQLTEMNTRLLGLLDQRLAAQGVTATVDQKAEMLQKLNEGDFSVAEGLIQRIVKEQYGPQMDLAAKTAAINAANQMSPYVKEYEAEVAARLRADPEANAIASANNYALAPKVLAAIAAQVRSEKLEAQVKELTEGRDKYAAQKLKEYQQRVQGLPASTSRAGTTPSGTPQKEYKSMREAMEEAANENPGLFST